MQQIKVLVLLKTKKKLNFLKIGFSATRNCKLIDPYPTQISKKIIGSGTRAEFFKYSGLDTRIFESDIWFSVWIFFNTPTC